MTNLEKNEVVNGLVSNLDLHDEWGFIITQSANSDGWRNIYFRHKKINAILRIFIIKDKLYYRFTLDKIDYNKMPNDLAKYYYEISSSYIQEIINYYSKYLKLLTFT